MNEDFLALAMDSLEKDTISPYTSEDTAIKIAKAKSEIEKRSYCVMMRRDGKWYSVGVAVNGVYTPEEAKEVGL